MIRRKVKDLRPGDIFDAYGDKYADPDKDPANIYAYEYVEVHEVERETPDCVGVFGEGFACGFPPEHEVWVK
jgi:hypothetical protein